MDTHVIQLVQLCFALYLHTAQVFTEKQESSHERPILSLS